MRAVSIDASLQNTDSVLLDIHSQSLDVNGIGTDSGVVRALCFPRCPLEADSHGMWRLENPESTAGYYALPRPCRPRDGEWTNGLVF